MIPVKKILRIVLICSPLLSHSEELTIKDFDSDIKYDDNWQIFVPAGADSELNMIQVMTDSQRFYQGNASLHINWNVHNYEQWGGLSRLEYWLQEDSLFSLSPYDTISFWYYNEQASSLPEASELRFMLFDVSDSPEGAYSGSIDSCEVYSSFHHILGNTAGWNCIKIPLIPADDINGNGFTLTGWYGITGNQSLDKNEIKGFALEFAVQSSSDSQHVFGEILIDELKAYTSRVTERCDIIFNGLAFAPGIIVEYIGQDGGIEVTEEEPYSATKSIKWVTSESELDTGPVFRFSEPLDYSEHWQINPLSFKIMPGKGRSDLRILITDDDTDAEGPDRPFGAEYVIPRAQFNLQGTWQEFQIPLQNFNRSAGYDNGEHIETGMMDSSRISTVQFLIADTAGLNHTIYLDDIMLGTPPNSVKPPQPQFWVVQDSARYLNLIVWDDLPEEHGEVYNIYYSTQPIVHFNLHSDDVELAAIELPEKSQSSHVFEHHLEMPLEDQVCSYYYSVTCVDAGGSECDPELTIKEESRARASAVINYVSDMNFSADGDLNDWQGFKSFDMYPSEGSGTVVDGTSIENNDDLAVRAWLACNADYLYIAFDITDDSLVFIDSPSNPWDFDSPQLYIGLYDAHNWPHRDLEAGDEPDYHFIFDRSGVHWPRQDTVLLEHSPGAYFFGKTGNQRYAVEAKLSLSELAQYRNDAVFSPQHLARIPIDFTVMDNDDGVPGAEGVLTYSRFNQDNSWTDVSLWSHTWIYNAPSSINSNRVSHVREFSLSQNYPNPFNPVTRIDFNLPKSCSVTLQIFDITGQKVALILDKELPAGHHSIPFESTHLASGIYFYKIQAAEFSDIKKMMLLH